MVVVPQCRQRDMVLRRCQKSSQAMVRTYGPRPWLRVGYKDAAASPHRHHGEFSQGWRQWLSAARRRRAGRPRRQQDFAYPFEAKCCVAIGTFDPGPFWVNRVIARSSAFGAKQTWD